MGDFKLYGKVKPGKDTVEIETEKLDLDALSP
jgi:hypothetical protein